MYTYPSMYISHAYLCTFDLNINIDSFKLVWYEPYNFLELTFEPFVYDYTKIHSLSLSFMFFHPTSSQQLRVAYIIVINR